mmetsp:Transcript_34602/g.103059  ORF Transcript_34602/g.103059 Transcript_34602/m.103059 type:complete len:82 (-) Transcript_34602:56-301(-)
MLRLLAATLASFDRLFASVGPAEMREAVVRAAEEKREADKGLAAAAGGGVLNASAGEIARGGEGRGALSRRVAGREVYNYV